jgi:hypothetical protein
VSAALRSYNMELSADCVELESLLGLCWSLGEDLITRLELSYRSILNPLFPGKSTRCSIDGLSSSVHPDR